MFACDLSQYAYSRADYFGEVGHLSGTVDAGFKYGDFSVRFQLPNREWHAKLRVPASGTSCSIDTGFCESMVEQFFYYRFAAAAGYADYGYIEVLSDSAGDLFECNADVIDDNEVCIGGVSHYVGYMVDDESAYASAIEVGEVAMSVIHVGAYRKKKSISGFDARTAVCKYGFYVSVRVSVNSAICG